jgi:hypothetical protein
MSRKSFGQFVNNWLSEAPGEQFKQNKWRFWFVALLAFQILNAVLTALVFSQAGRLQAYMGSVLLGVGALLCWLGVAFLYYSDGSDRRLAGGVAILDSVTLCFAVAHFAFLMWVYGHLSTLQNAEKAYAVVIAKHNADAQALQESNARIADAIQKAADARERTAKIEQDVAYQYRQAAKHGAKIKREAGGINANIEMGKVELAKPPDPPKDSSADYLTRWDSTIRLANFGELVLAVATLIFIRVRTSRTNTPAEEDFPDEIEAGITQDDRSGRRLSQTRKSGSRRQPPAAAILGDRRAALEKLREHLGVIASYCPGYWLRADLLAGGGVLIRMSHRVNGFEEQAASTRQSDKLLTSVDRPDFLKRLVDELIHQGFPIEKEKMNL